MGQKDVLRQADSLLKARRLRRWWMRVVTGMASVVVFVTTYLLILPAITMEHGSIEVETPSSTATPGAPCFVQVQARAAGQERTFFVLCIDGHNAGSDEIRLPFVDDTAVLADEGGLILELRREYQSDGTVQLWFALDAGQESLFSLPFVNGADRLRTQTVAVDAPQAGPLAAAGVRPAAQVSFLGRAPTQTRPSAAALTALDVPQMADTTPIGTPAAPVSSPAPAAETLPTATSTPETASESTPAPAPAAAPESAPAAETAPQTTPEAVPEITPAPTPENAPESTPAPTPESTPVPEATVPPVSWRTELVLEAAGDPAGEGSLTLAWGCGATREAALAAVEGSAALRWAADAAQPEPPAAESSPAPSPAPVTGIPPEGATSWATVSKIDAAPLLRRIQLFAAPRAAGTPHDFGQDITQAIVSKLENGSWTPATEFTDGDEVRIELHYSLPANVVDPENRTIVYDLPDGIALDGEQSGLVYDGVTPVGSYSISPEGHILIEFDESFADTKPLDGTITFQGTVSADADDTDRVITFPSGNTITVKPAETPADARIQKTGSYNDGTGKLHYTLTVSTTNGTAGPVTVTDHLQNGNTPVDYDQGSFVITKVGANGQETTLGGYSLVFGDTTPDSFTLEGLQELDAGESYRIEYTATPGATTSERGESSVSNYADVITPGGSQSSWNNVTISQSMIGKQGYYDAGAGVIRWTISLNPDGRDIGGWTLADSITTPEGVTAPLPATVTLTGPNGAQEEVTLPYTFPAGSTGACTVTYETPVSGLEPGESAPVTNSATFGKDDEQYGQAVTVTPTARDFGLSKDPAGSEESEDGQTGLYQWTTTLTVPSGITGEDLDALAYTDTLHDPVGADGQPAAGSHFITAAQLEELTVSLEGGTPLTRGKDYTLLDDQGEPITDFSAATRYTGFRLHFTEAALKKLDGNTVRLAYKTTVDRTALQGEDAYTIRNTGAIPGRTDDAEARWERPRRLEKQTSATGAHHEFSGGLTLDYEASGGIIHYRLLVHADADATGPITLTDTLPAGAQLVEGSPEMRFYYNDYYETDSIPYWDGSANQTYTCADHLHTSLQGSVVTFTIDKGYNPGNTDTTLAIYYQVSVKEDPAWTDDPTLEQKLYRNLAAWDEEAAAVDVTVEREVPVLAKTGAQLPVYGADGQPVLGADGQPMLSNTLRYSVVVNAGAEDLDPARNVLELVDTISAAPGVTLELGGESVRLYRYDPEAAGLLGEPIDPARYQYVYDRQAHTLTFTLPDSTALVLVYEYTVDRGDMAGDLHISNQASLTGVAGGEAGDDTVLADVSSSSTATKRELTVYKVDAENYGTLLQGAVFTLEEYENDWTTRRNNLTTDANGQFTLVRTDDEQFPEFNFQDGVLYRLTETSPPPGYAIPPQGCVYYFVWVGADQTVDSCRQQLAGTVAAAGAQLEDVLFIDNSDAIFVPNESTTVQVKKLWLNEDGGALAGAGPVEVTLWRQATASNAVTVTVHSVGLASWTQDTLSLPVQVAENSELTVQINTWTSGEYAVDIPGQPTRYLEQSGGTFSFDVPVGETDLTVTVTSPSNTPCLDSSAVSFPQSTPPAYLPAGSKEKVAVIQLSEGNGWAHTWADLDRTAPDGAPYLYTVEEAPVAGFHTIYSPNNENGVSSGELVILNQANGYLLPETGGPGQSLFAAAGLALLAPAGLLLALTRRKGEDSS